MAKAAGYELAKLEGDPREIVLIDWGHIEECNYQGEWSETPADPLLVLIAHSDCDGVIHPEQAKPLADRLEELLPLLDADGFVTALEVNEALRRLAAEARQEGE